MSNEYKIIATVEGSNDAKKDDVGKNRVSCFVSIFNSKFFITIIGGVLITILAQNLQKQNSISQLMISRDHQLLDKRLDLLEKFTNGFVHVLQMSYPIKLREIWLSEQKDKAVHSEKFEDDRTYEQTRDKYEKDMLEFNKIGSSDTLCALVRALYNDPNNPTTAGLHKITKELDGIMDEYIELGSSRDNNISNGQSSYENLSKRLSVLFDKSSAKYQGVVEEMGLYLSFYSK